MRKSAQATSVRGALVWFAASYVGAVLGFLVVNAAAGRWLGPDRFGFFVAALSAAGLLGQLGLVGSHRAGLREVAQLREDPDPEQMARLRNGVRAVSLTTLPLAGLVAGVGTWMLAGDVPVSARLGLAVALAALVVLGGQQQLWANYVRGLGHVRFAGLLEGRSGGTLVAGLQALCVLLAWWLVPGSGLVGALAAVAAGFVLPVLAAATVVTRHWRGLGGPAPRLLSDLRRTVARDWRFLSAQVAAFLNVSLEVWIAGLLLSGYDTSMFSAGQRVALLLLMPLTGLQVVLAPVIARARNRPDSLPAVETVVRAGASVATAVSLLLALPLVVAPGLVLRVVFGSGFSGAVPVLLVLTVAVLGNVATGMAGTALSMLGREDVSARVQWAGAVLRTGLGVPAALVWGLPGLVASALAASCFVFTVMWWQARTTVGVSTQASLRPDLSSLGSTRG